MQAALAMAIVGVLSMSMSFAALRGRLRWAPGCRDLMGSSGVPDRFRPTPAR